VVLSSLPPLLEEGELPEESASKDNILRNSIRNDRDKMEEIIERMDSTSHSPPCASSKGAEVRRKRKW
jgi:hypothetical protein